MEEGGWGGVDRFHYFEVEAVEGSVAVELCSREQGPEGERVEGGGLAAERGPKHAQT